MKVEIRDIKNKKVGMIDLPDSVFKAKWNPRLVHQVVTAQLSNSRKPLAHTKTRGEVRGGGKKPWRQKHTGRARHGSSRSPLWAGGGVTFGPRSDKKFKKKINKKMKAAALFSVLSKKLADDEVKIIENFKLESRKTKELAAILGSFFGKVLPSILILEAGSNRNVYFAGRNIPKVKVTMGAAPNVYDCLAHKNLLFDKESILRLASRYGSGK